MNKLRRLWKLAFGDEDRIIDAFFEAAWSPDRCRYLTEGEEIAAALYWLDGELAGEKYAYIYGVATHPDYRGRGLCRRLMALTHEQLAREGYAGALLMPADPGLRRMYAGMGYRDCGGISEFSAAAEGSAVPLRPVGVEEYASLRRKYLPEGGALQEEENIAYLEMMAFFYEGPDFLLAAQKMGKHLYCPELLGSRDAGPGIVAALGCESGHFRSPGDSQPGTMLFPLVADVNPPRYLGLTFE